MPEKPTLEQILFNSAKWSYYVGGHCGDDDGSLTEVQLTA